MTKLTKITSSVLLLAFLSGCQQNLSEPAKPKFDETLEMIDHKSIKHLADIKDIAFEWRKVDDPRATGYYLYRSNMVEDGAKLKRIAHIKNKYTTHYVDSKLEANTKYSYAFSTSTKDGRESKPTAIYQVMTTPTLSSVSFIQAISNLPRQIKILWRPHENPRVAYYEVQRTSPTTAKWETLKKLEGRLQSEFIDEDLKDSVVYSYRVIAYTFDDIPTKNSKMVKAQTKALPLGVKDLRATTNQPRKIVLSWKPSSTKDVLKYKIYRSDKPDGSFDPIKIISAKSLQFEDLMNEDGLIKFYKVTSIDKDGLETALNMNATMGSTLQKLNKPILTLAQIQGQKAILNWQAGDKRAVSFIVYKTVSEGFTSSKTIKFNNIKALRFEDKDIVRGVEYKYSIQSLDKYGIPSGKTRETQLVLPKLQEN